MSYVRNNVLHPGAGFTPRQFNNLSVWLRSDMGTVIDYTAPISIATWQNQNPATGTTYDFLNSTKANQPAFVTDVLNGYPVVRFTASNHRLFTGAAGKDLANNVSGMSIFWVGKTQNNATNQCVFLASTNASTSANRVTVYKTNANKYETGGKRTDLDTDQFVIESGTDPAAFNYFSSIIDFANTKADMWRGGVNIGTTTAYQTAGSTDATNSASMMLGATGAATNHAVLDIAEFIVYKRALTSQERLTIENYLKGKYGL